MSKDKRSHETLQRFYSLREKPNDDTTFWTDHWINSGAELNARDYRGRTRLIIAAELGNSGAVDRMVSGRCGPEARNRDGRSAIYVPARTEAGFAALPDMLRGASAEGQNHQDANGMTRCTGVAHKGQEDHILQFMIDQGEDPAIRDQNNRLATDWLGDRASYVALLHGRRRRRRRSRPRQRSGQRAAHPT